MRRRCCCKSTCDLIANFSATPWEDGFTFVFQDESTSSVPIVSAEWDFGDGTTGSGSVVEHTFPVPPFQVGTFATYEVILTVTDAKDCVAKASKRFTFGDQCCGTGARRVLTQGPPVIFEPLPANLLVSIENHPGSIDVCYQNQMSGRSWTVVKSNPQDTSDENCVWGYIYTCSPATPFNHERIVICVYLYVGGVFIPGQGTVQRIVASATMARVVNQPGATPVCGLFNTGFPAYMQILDRFSNNYPLDANGSYDCVNFWNTTRILNDIGGGSSRKCQVIAL